MSTGALIYATDGDIAYTKIAQECARRVEQYIGLPSTIVSGSSTVTGNRAWADCENPVACVTADGVMHYRIVLTNVHY